MSKTTQPSVHHVKVGQAVVYLSLGDQQVKLERVIYAGDVVRHRTMRGAIEKNLIAQFREAWDNLLTVEEEEDE